MASLQNEHFQEHSVQARGFNRDGNFHGQSTLPAYDHVVSNESSPLLPPYTKVDHKKTSQNDAQCLAARHILAFMAFMGFFNVYCLRVNLSVALVAMVNSTEKNDSAASECPDPNGNTTSSTTQAEFDWDESTQGIVLGSFFYGYITTQIPGGWLASKIGGKKLFGYGVLCTSVLTLITPVAVRYSVYLFIAVRVLEGIGEGVTFPAMHAMWGEWAPVWERSKLAAFTYAGAQLGTVFSLPISGVLCDSNIAGGWPSVFYVFGGLGCLWFIAWMLLTSNTPAEHSRISSSEREYIESSIGKKENLATPWKQILTSPAVLACCVAHFSYNWGFYTLLTCLPTYMKSILKFNMKENGLLSALPYLVLWIMQNVCGILADYLRRHGYLTTKVTRKLFNSAGLAFPGLFVIFVGYVGCNHLLAVVFLTLSVGLGGFAMGGFNVNHLDIAPKFAGSLMGITNCVATIPGFVAPAVVGYLTDNNNTRQQWQTIFYISASISFFGALFYAIFSEGEERSWSRQQVKGQTTGDRDADFGIQNQTLIVPPPSSSEIN
ncbi:vesicular glutamate transporter 2 [Plakobranchus ocellatus]|uniref:Sialin n=1 Tax=Plakobranchus ocellatus TaxID=259542 RepID=A0AAV3ZRZ4_9GAST|nr:vesicular glutamate transporter 2 [Plakobranchus ocellatus]